MWPIPPPGVNGDEADGMVVIVVVPEDVDPSVASICVCSVDTEVEIEDASDGRFSELCRCLGLLASSMSSSSSSSSSPPLCGIRPTTTVLFVVLARS